MVTSSIYTTMGIVWGRCGCVGVFETLFKTLISLPPRSNFANVYFRLWRVFNFRGEPFVNLMASRLSIYFTSSLIPLLASFYRFDHCATWRATGTISIIAPPGELQAHRRVVKTRKAWGRCFVLVCDPVAILISPNQDALLIEKQIECQFL
jgi:hypothetical protein